MANQFRIKRRANGGAAGAPATLLTSELAYNETDDILYIGFGDDGGGNATSIRAFAGAGAALMLLGAQTVAGIKTFSDPPLVPNLTANDNSLKSANTAYVDAAVVSAGGGDMSKAAYDTNDDGKVDAADVADSVSAGATGTTETAVDNSTKLATTAFVQTVIAGVLDSAPGALDTLNELAAALGDDPNFATTMTNALAGKADTVLGNLANVATAKTNLALGSMADQNANTVAITGGTIDGVTLDGGTF